jgi:hypothetical protein
MLELEMPAADIQAMPDRMLENCDPMHQVRPALSEQNLQ